MLLLYSGYSESTSCSMWVERKQLAEQAWNLENLKPWKLHLQQLLRWCRRNVSKTKIACIGHWLLPRYGYHTLTRAISSPQIKTLSMTHSSV